MNRLARIVSLAVVFAPWFATACGGGNKNQPPPGPSVTATPPPPSSTASATASAPASVFPSATASTIPSATASGTPPGNACTPLDPTAAGAAGKVLDLLAKSSAPGMAKDGSPMAGTCADGQSMETPFTLQPGKCYTFVAGGVGPQQLDISIAAQSLIPGLPGLALGNLTGTGGKVVFGGGANCYRLALVMIPVPARFIVKASKGAGPVVAQVYSK